MNIRDYTAPQTQRMRHQFGVCWYKVRPQRKKEILGIFILLGAEKITFANENLPYQSYRMDPFRPGTEVLRQFNGKKKTLMVNVCHKIVASMIDDEVWGVNDIKYRRKA